MSILEDEIRPELKNETQATEDAKKWDYKNFRGKRTLLEIADQQYLSNMYWAQRIIYDKAPEDDVFLIINKELSHRFNAQLLPYRPHIDNKPEMQFLLDKGMIQKRKDHFLAYDIRWNAQIIGEIITERIIL